MQMDNPVDEYLDIESKYDDEPIENKSKSATQPSLNPSIPNEVRKLQALIAPIKNALPSTDSTSLPRTRYGELLPIVNLLLMILETTIQVIRGSTT
jgi:hypothetical protein